MRSTLREYGLIIGLIVISISGYLLFAQNKEDILAYSLDMLGTKLVNMLDDEAAKARVALAFDRFEQQVLNDEIAPQQVEFVAANVLNLANSKARLSEEEAELVLTLQSEITPEQLPSPSAPPAPQQEGMFESQRTRLEDNLSTMIQFATEVNRNDSTSGRLIRFESGQDGMHVVVDTDLEKHIQSKDFAVVTRILDKRNLLKWNSELEKDLERNVQWFELQEKRLAAFESTKVRSEEQSVRIKTLERLGRLRSMGALTIADSTIIGNEIEQIVAEAMAEVGTMMSERAVRIHVKPDSLVRRRN